jgi:hypothetical protein
MADENRIGGTSYVTYGGTSLTLGTGTHTISLALFERTGVPRSDGGGAGYTEAGRVPFIEIEALTDSDLDMTELQNITNETIVSELANGKVATLNEAWLAGTPDVDANAGTVSVRFEGKSGQWS